MNRVLEFLKKPYGFLSQKLSLNSKTQLVSPSKAIADEADVFYSILSPFEAYILTFQSLLIWERPFSSAVAFVSINIFYWVVVSWNRRFFSILSLYGVLLFLCMFCFKVWQDLTVPLLGSENTKNLTSLDSNALSVPELRRYLNNIYEKMLIIWNQFLKLRQENHGLFCAMMCGFFSVLAIIGKVIPGVLLVYFLLLLISLGPGIALHLIPSTVYDQLAGCFMESENQDSEVSKPVVNLDKDSDIEEFVPEESAEVLQLLSIKDDVPEVPSPGMVLTASGTPDADDSMKDDELALYQGLGSFPSVEEEGESDLEDIISESDILPIPEKPKQEEMQFVSSHFKEDSSESESDAVFTEGLSFNQKNEGLAAEVAASTKSNKESTEKRKRSSSDFDEDLEDFEILDESDVLS